MGTTASGDDVEGSTTSGNNEGVVKAPHTSADMAPGQSSSKTKGGTANASTDSTNAQAPHGASVDGPRGTDSANSSPTAAGNHAPKKGLADPVDAWTGHVFETVQDLCIAAPQQIPTKTLSPDLPGQSGNGAWPFGFTRHYDSGAANESLPFGPGWSHGFDQFIFETAGRLSCRRPDGRYLDLGDALIRSPDRPQRLRGANLEATRQGDYIYLRELRGSRTYTFTRFPNQKLANCWWLTAITDARGNGIDLYYDRTGSVPSLSRVMDRRGWSFLLEYDQTGRISAVCLLKSAAGGEAIEVAKTRYEYHEAGELARVVDADSIRTEYIYDGFHRLSKARFPLGLEVNWQYDASGFCKKTSGSGGYYHRELTRTSLDCTVATGNSSAEEFHFGPQGQLLIERALDDRLRTEREYDEDLFVTKQANAAGETWEYEYDSLGNKTREVDPAGNITQWSYWPGYASIKSDAGQFTEAWYDDFGDLIRTRDRGGEERYFARDQQGRITAVYAGSADPNDRGVLLEKRFYDEQGLLLYREDARGLRTSYQYDALGYVAQRTDTFGDGRASRTWTYQHDVYGRLLVQTFPDGSAERFEHTAHGLVTRSVDAAGRTTHSTYSTTGKLLSRRRPDGAEWHYRYDLEDRLASITNPRGEEHSYRYNLSGQLTGEDTFDGRKLSYSYDLAGRVQRIERSDGTYREFTYDPLGNVLEETTSSGKLTFERDSHGRVMKATAEDAQATIETHFERDTLGRVICERIGPTDEFELRWAYDSRGRVKSRTAL
ncbi:MAG: RHS repeat protein, partial [Myxococcales bacterium]|nr:RHS repeat protein [Myxococcales bacterium]